MDVTNAEQAKSALLGYVEAEIAPEDPVLVERHITLPDEAPARHANRNSRMEPKWIPCL